MTCVGESRRDFRNLGGISYFGLDSIPEVDGFLTNGGLEEPLETLKHKHWCIQYYNHYKESYSEVYYPVPTEVNYLRDLAENYKH